jgi:type II secretory pathway pseudopilin PulG
MTLLVILALVAVVAASLLIVWDVRRERRAKREAAVARQERRRSFAESERAQRSSDPVPIEHVQRTSPNRAETGSVGDVNNGGPVEAVAHQVAPAAGPKKRSSKPRATRQTVHEALRHHGPATAKEVAAMLRDTTPSKVATILVGLRRDGKATSEQQRNLKLWKAL